MIRLSKRMTELDICSRREADRHIRNGQVLVDGQVAMIGQKVDGSISVDRIQIQVVNKEEKDNKEIVETVVLHKPRGYVSGQAEHGHPPAICLLSQDRQWYANNNTFLPKSWKGFATAGRLDLESTGLLVFTSSGVIAKKIIHSESSSSSSTAVNVMEKEYIVEVEPAQHVTKRERELNGRFELPNPSTKLLAAGVNLEPVRNGGVVLLGDYKPLKPCHVEWMEPGKRLRVILTEGRKQQIRRMCRELLGYHVLGLHRVRIGPIHIGELPEGFWRPLTPREIKELLA